jgi:hypothetical protein
MPYAAGKRSAALLQVLCATLKERMAIAPNCTGNLPPKAPCNGAAVCGYTTQAQPIISQEPPHTHQRCNTQTVQEAMRGVSTAAVPSITAQVVNQGGLPVSLLSTRKGQLKRHKHTQIRPPQAVATTGDPSLRHL